MDGFFADSEHYVQNCSNGLMSNTVQYPWDALVPDDVILSAVARFGPAGGWVSVLAGDLGMSLAVIGNACASLIHRRLLEDLPAQEEDHGPRIRLTPIGAVALGCHLRNREAA